MRDDDPVSNNSSNAHFSDLIDARLRRRDLLGGATAFSAWPAQADGSPGPRPRSACVVITKDDGGPIGS